MRYPSWFRRGTARPSLPVYDPARSYQREPHLSSVAVAPRARKSFSRLKHVLDLPNLIDIQKASFDWFMEAGLRETIDDISPIEDYTGTLAVEFGEYEFGEPQFTIQESREKDLTYQVPLSITVRFVNKETGEIREQRVFMGDFPMMTPWGTFVINGTERVIVTQLVRSPGAYLMEPKDADEAGLHGEPDAVARVLARGRDRQEGHRVRPHRPEAEAADHDAPASAARRGPDDRVPARHELEREDPRAARRLDVHRQHAREGSLDARGGGADRGVQEAAARRAADSRQRAQPPSLALLRPEALRPHARRPLQAEPAARRRRAGRRPRPHDGGHRRARPPPHRPADEARRDRGVEGLRGGRRPALARPDPRRARRVRGLRQPPPAHDGRADPGGVPGRPVPDGARRPRADDDGGRRHDHAADDHQHPARRRRAEGVLRLVAAVAVHGPDEHALRPHPPPAPVGARRGRPDA